MPNPLLSNISMASNNTSGNISGNPQIFSQLKNMMNILNSAQNPDAALQMLASKNPMFAQVMNLVSGQNPKDVFYKLCEQKGVNPDYILNNLK